MTNFSDGAQPSLMETTMQKIIDDPTFDLREAAASRWKIKRQPIFWFLPHCLDSTMKNQNFKFWYDHFDAFLKPLSISATNFIHTHLAPVLALGSDRRSDAFTR